MPKLKPGDVIHLTGSSADEWFGSTGPFIVAAWPSQFPDWDYDIRVARSFVDIVNMDGTPPRYTGQCINACAQREECVPDKFLTIARRANKLGVPPCPVNRNSNGWAK